MQPSFASQLVPTPTARKFAPRLAKIIEPNERAVPLSPKDKMEMALRGQIEPYAFGTQLLSAGWEQLIGGNPQYGSDSAGFGERLGAAALRQGSQAIFTNAFAAAYREDPRYYVQGSGTFMNRAVYAATRVFITRTDTGQRSVNYSQLFGYAGASALTMTYYPAVSATWPKTTEGYFLSLAASALGNEVHEFLPDVVRLALHRHR